MELALAVQLELECQDGRTFGPGGLRAPCVLACAMRSLAIVITIVQSLSPLFFSPSFAFDPLRGISHVRDLA